MMYRNYPWLQVGIVGLTHLLTLLNFVIAEPYYFKSLEEARVPKNNLKVYGGFSSEGGSESAENQSVYATVEEKHFPDTVVVPFHFESTPDNSSLGLYPTAGRGTNYTVEVGNITYLGSVQPNLDELALITRANDRNTGAYYGYRTQANFYAHMIVSIVIVTSNIGFMIFDAMQGRETAVYSLAPTIAVMMTHVYSGTPNGDQVIQTITDSSASKRDYSALEHIPLLEQESHGVLNDESEWRLVLESDKYQYYRNFSAQGTHESKVLFAEPQLVGSGHGLEKRDNYVYGIYVNMRETDDLRWEGVNAHPADAHGIADFILGTMMNAQAPTVCLFGESPVGYTRLHGQIKLLFTNWDNQVGPTPYDCHFNYPCEMQNGRCAGHDEL